MRLVADWFSPGPVVAFGLEIMVRATLMLAVAFLATALMRRASAATRHAVWSMLLAGLLLVPFVSSAFPVWSLRLPGMRTTDRVLAHTPGVMPGDAVGAVGVPGLKPDGPPRGPAAPRADLHGSVPHHVGDLQTTSAAGQATLPRPIRVPGAVWLLLAWWSGLLLVSGSLLRDVLAVWRLTRRAAADETGRMTVMVERVARSLGLKRPVSVLFTEELTVPVNWGVVRPVILLPPAADEWSAERLHVVLLHELAHIKRWDYLTHILTELACAVYWLHPLAWMAARRSRTEQERACDDAVLQMGTRSGDYAEHLLEIARGFSERRAALGGALAMAQPSTLRRRVWAILRGDVNRRALAPGTWLLAGAVAVVVALPLGTLRLWGANAERQLVATLVDSDPVIRQRAAWSLGERGSSRAVSSLIARLGDDVGSVRGAAAWALGEIGDEHAVGPMGNALRDSDPRVREMVVLGLSKMGPGAVDYLIGALEDPEPGVRSVTTEALIKAGDPRAAARLSEVVFNDPDSHTRGMAAWALRMLDPEGSIPVVLRMLRDSSSEARRHAAYVLTELDDPRATESLVDRLRRDPDIEVRQTAARALGRSSDPQAVEGLVAGLNDPETDVRATAAWALGQKDVQRAIDALLATALHDPQHTVRLTAVRALDRINDRLRG